MAQTQEQSLEEGTAASGSAQGKSRRHQTGFLSTMFCPDVTEQAMLLEKRGLFLQLWLQT